MQVYRAYKFLMRPTSKQADALAACLEDHRQLYNAALEERREAWRPRRKGVTVLQQQAQLKEIRKADPDGQGRWAYCSQRHTVRRLDQAFQGFFCRVKAGEKAGYPRFKSLPRFNMVTWDRYGDGCRWDSAPHLADTRVYLKGIGHVRVHQHRMIRGYIKMIIIKREGRRWFVVLILSRKNMPAEPLPATGAAVGIDLGLRHFVTTSDGVHVPNRRFAATESNRLTAARKDISRKQRGSKRRAAATARLADMHRKLRRRRLDRAHKTALALVQNYDVIVHEHLQIASMIKRPSPRPVGDGTYEHNGAANKAGMNKAILDAAWGSFLRILNDKAESAGRTVIAVNPKNTSRTCAECGHVAKENRNGEAFCCITCGHEAHADVNAAVNILRAGLARQVAQAA